LKCNLDFFTSNIAPNLPPLLFLSFGKFSIPLSFCSPLFFSPFFHSHSHPFSSLPFQTHSLTHSQTPFYTTHHTPTHHHLLLLFCLHFCIVLLFPNQPSFLLHFSSFPSSLSLSLFFSHPILLSHTPPTLHLLCPHFCIFFTPTSKSLLHCPPVHFPPKSDISISLNNQ
jgi:hypothetical protein